MDISLQSFSDCDIELFYQAICEADSRIMNEIAISARDLSLTYRVRKSLFRSANVRALNKVSFDVYAGETLGIIGRNGSGKSTLLRVLAGIYQCDSGELTISTNSISLMTLSLGFDPVLTGRANAVFGGMLLGFSHQQVLSVLDSIKDFSGLKDAFEVPVKTYSSGMLSRLAFSLAIILSPDIMLLDEVLSVGDQEFKEKAYDKMLEKISSTQTTVFVSHSLEEVEKICDRAILIDDGVVLASGKPAEISKEYRKLLP